MRGYPFDMLLSELADVVGEQHVSTRASDKLAYATDWSWMSQVWLDRGEEPVTPDVIVHPGSTEEISKVLKIANVYRIPVVPWGGGSGAGGAHECGCAARIDRRRGARAR